jgi:hypothetical protein
VIEVPGSGRKHWASRLTSLEMSVQVVEIAQSFATSGRWRRMLSRSVSPWLSIILVTCEERVGSSVVIKASRKLWSVVKPASRMLWRARLSCEVICVFFTSASQRSCSWACVCSCARRSATACRISASSSSVCFLATRRFFSSESPLV